MKKEFLKTLNMPAAPGVYFFQKGKEILYIGKATSLKERVKSYFSSDLIDTRGELTVDMVARSDNLKWQVADSVLEALIQEALLIKKHQPYYNIREKDDKSWNHVCITRPARNATHSVAGGGNLPIIIVERARNINFSEKRVGERKYSACYGPFTSGRDLSEALKLIRRIFPYLDEKSKAGYEFYKQVHLVPDVSTREKIAEYKKNIKNIKLFFEGKKKKILRNLEREMKAHAKSLRFERAGEVKGQIFALKHINDVALLKSDNIRDHYSFRIEAYDIAHMSGKSMVGVMTVVDSGRPAKSEYRMFRIRTQKNSNDTGALTEVLRRRLNHREWPYPNLVVVDGGVAQLNAANELLRKQQVQIPVVSVLKDERHKPLKILGDSDSALNYKREILLSNNESHRFAITYHKKLRARNFLKK
jgi:excinuclease ABC subunit C